MDWRCIQQKLLVYYLSCVHGSRFFIRRTFFIVQEQTLLSSKWWFLSGVLERAGVYLMKGGIYFGL